MTPQHMLMFAFSMIYIFFPMQIMADSAHECIQMLLAECQTAKLMAMMAEGVVKEKNPKSRKFCAAYLVQVGAE